MSLSNTNIPLHSPNPKIVGTPFQVDNAGHRFEYPFPESTTQPSPQAMTIPTLPSPTSLCQLQYSLPSAPVEPLSSTRGSGYSPTHPKHRLVYPPVPPELQKRLGRLSLEVKARRSARKGSNESQSDEGATTTCQDAVTPSG